MTDNLLPGYQWEAGYRDKDKALKATRWYRTQVGQSVRGARVTLRDGLWWVQVKYGPNDSRRH